jgi:Fe-S cluster biogenesis protein NfuA
MEAQVLAALEEIRPALQADGGDLEFIDMVDKTIRLRLRGACGTCPYAVMTLKNGIERVLRETVDSELVVERVM